MSHATDDLLAYMPEAVVGIDTDQRIVYFNPAAERAFGYALGEIAGQKLDLLIPPALRAAHRGHVTRFRDSGSHALIMHERTTISAQRRDGSEFPAEATIVHGRLRGATVFFAIIRDITEQRNREQALRASEAKYRAILECSPEAILIADAATGRLTDANVAAARLFGCSRRELIDLHQTELHPEETREKFRDTFRQHVEEGRVLVPDGLIKTADGRIVPVEITAAPVIIDNRQHLVGFFRDITHQQAHEREMRQALSAANAASEAKKTFLANMSHELRTPLNGIIGFADLIAEEIHGPHAQASYKEYGAIIRQSGRHLLEIVNDVLDLSRLDANQYRLDKEGVVVAEVAGEVRAMLKPLLEEARLSLDLEIDGDLCLHADRRALKQMLINLLSNAIKFTPSGRWIRISAARDDDRRITITVSDGGIGIRPELLATITDPFASGQEIYVKSKGGTGIGLSITRRLVELHGGEFRLESAPGSGTRAHLVFPGEDQAAGKPVRLPQRMDAAGGA
ncbi:PAS domain S-box-containing protein [Dongia mobilis]|uniref:histidine kinase n=1 Tax=Dongia mobilis TaxID=578943 RepID=A0A4R6WVZ2_9PROT|nr:PAS domain-containing sensor histidine kinase [Dongia mobilis]TDQ83837.1 PAS domain S-box-containing protein [Dongia mobilis]